MDSPDQSHDTPLYRLRHSLAHVMAQAVLAFRPGSKLGFGPPIDDGFYYDFILTSPISEEDFPELEKRMRGILAQGQPFQSEDLPRDQALARIDEMGEPYKREYAQELIEKRGLPGLRFYKNGPFLDMCEGPHVGNTKEIPADCFRLRTVAGAYWRGESKNAMMTRIYAWAFENREELDKAVKAYEDALARDHKKLGRELEIFAIDDVIGRGLPLWLPNGTVIRDELEKLMKELEFQAGYVRVATPHLAKVDLYYQTGHLPYYAEHMFPFMDSRTKPGADPNAEPEVYCLKPMNCPHHHRIFAARRRSYRELPLRLAEYGQVYRYEDSGAVSGLLRVRGMSMNDAHIYCTKDQITSEFRAVIDMHRRVYDILGIEDYSARFSTRDPANAAKYFEHQGWDECEAIVLEVLEDSGLKWVEGKGEAAFYGPKIDFQFRTVTGREETASTVQLDFAVPERLDLSYIGADNSEHRPYIIHRAPAGTHERFTAFLIERYAGAFPTWLAPIQVRVLPVSATQHGYARSLVDKLRARFVRAEMDDSSDTVSKKVREGTVKKIPNLLIVGKREEAEGTVTLRRYGVTEQKAMPMAEFETWVLDQIATRARG
jgi:threonyl-tRNA synthetase